MKIKIDDNYSLSSDARNVMLVENKVSQEGKEYETTVGYYGTVETALKGYLRLKINSSDAITVPELMADIKRVEKTIEAVLKGY